MTSQSAESATLNFNYEQNTATLAALDDIETSCRVCNTIWGERLDLMAKEGCDHTHLEDLKTAREVFSERSTAIPAALRLLVDSFGDPILRAPDNCTVQTTLSVESRSRKEGLSQRLDAVLPTVLNYLKGEHDAQWNASYKYRDEMRE